MTLLQWRDDFCIGIAEVDHEHQVLIGLINEVHAALGVDRSSERIEDFLGEIHARISAHFALEEKDMRSRKYTEFNQHKADHERLLDDIRDIMDDHTVRGVLDDQALSNRLATWFGDHFKTYDARLHSFLLA
ncbi:MAG: hemerythrin family protein [Proteobacteria bacterium]|nr:hemerythrin family protein [Pseudomonadota bacterium]